MVPGKNENCSLGIVKLAIRVHCKFHRWKSHK